MASTPCLPAPMGLGIWVAFAGNAGGYRKILPQLPELGVSWIAPRAGRGGWNDPGLQSTDIDLAHKLDLLVLPWIYSVPSKVDDEIAAFQALQHAGADGLIVNAEVPWLAYKTEASEYVDRLRQALPSTWMAHAPMDYLDYHPTFPYREFGALDAVLPQVYAWEHDDRGHPYHLAEVDRRWTAWERQNGISTPRHPIGCTYRPPRRGGRRLQPRDIDWDKDLAPLLAQLDDGKPISLYSFEAAAPRVRALLRERASNRHHGPVESGVRTT